VNTEQLSRLAQRAEDMTGRQDHRLDEVRDRIRTVRRRRTAGKVLGAAALMVVVALAAGSLVGSERGTPNPAPSPDPIKPSAGIVRPLTWTDEWWPSRRINHGDRVIDTRLDLTKHDFSQMDLTDDGVVVTTLDGRIWLADTSSVEQIGDSHITHSFLSIFEVRTGNAGSLATWIEDPRKGAARLVVYDTGQREVVARHRFEPSYWSLLLVGTDRVYWETRPSNRIQMLEVATGRVSGVSQDEYAAALLSQRRSLVVGDSFDRGAVSDGVDDLFIRKGARLLATEPSDRGDLRSTASFDSTGSPIRLRVPEGYDGARSFTTFQWLDDDRLALMAGAGSMGFVPGLDPDLPADNDGYGDIMVCRISSGTCRLAVRGPGPPPVDPATQTPEYLRLVPHYGTPGTN
jgi:hypothetical protein